MLNEEVNIRTLDFIIDSILSFFPLLPETEGVGLLLGQLYSFSIKCVGALIELKSNPTSFVCEDRRLIRTSFKAAVRLWRTLN